MFSELAFRKALKSLCAQCPSNVAGWSDDGSAFEVREPAAFRVELAKLFKSSASGRSQGVLIAFCRALKAFGFEFSAPGVNSQWKFWHSESLFSCSSQDKKLVMDSEIARSMSLGLARNQSMQNVKEAVIQTEKCVASELANLSSQVAVIKGLVMLYVQKNSATKRKAESDAGSVATATTKAMRKKAMFETASLNDDSDGSESVSSLA